MSLDSVPPTMSSNASETSPRQFECSTLGHEKLSPHFCARELWCKHCHVLWLSPLLLPALETLRLRLAERAGRELPIITNSVYRCTYHNRREGGSPTSQHLRSCAADIRTSSPTLLQVLYEAALEVPTIREGGIGIYPEADFIHVDCRTTGPGRWGWLGGRFVSIDEALKRI